MHCWLGGLPQRHFVGLYEDWLWLDQRIDTITTEIEEISQHEVNCIRMMSVPGVGP